MDDDAFPQLPRHDPMAAREEQLRLDLSAPAPSDDAIEQVEWQPYEEPELLSLRGAKWIVVTSRVTVAAWSAALLITAVTARQNTGGGDSADMRDAGTLGIAAAFAAALGGWYWSDRMTRNIHLLDSPLPHRRRCISAWAAPPFWIGLLSVTVLQLDATELVDLRPPFMIAIFIAAMTRPYALCRRMVKSVSRIDSDVLIGTGFVLDLAGFGLVWWQLWIWPEQVANANPVNAETHIGLVGAAMVALFANVAVWQLLVRDIGAKLDHRATALRTRDEHRQLRLRHIDPMDPKVRWALHRIHQDTYEPEHADHPSEPTGEAPAPEQTTEQIEHTAPATGETPSPARSDEPAEHATELTSEATAPARTDRDAGSDTHSAGDLSTDAAPSVAAASDESDDAPTSDDPADRLRDRLRHAAATPEPPKGAALAFDDAETATTRPSAERRTEDLVARLSDRASTPRRSTGDATRQPSPPESSHREKVEQSSQDRLERIVRRLDENERERSDNTMLDRLARFGISPPDEAVPVPGQTHDEARALEGPADDELVVQRLYVLELMRYVVLLAFVSTAFAAGWLITRAVSIELVDGEIPGTGVDRLDLARRVMIGALGIAFSLVPLWATTVGVWARRSGVRNTTVRRDAVLFGIATIANLVMIVVEPDRGDLWAVGMLVCLAAAAWSIAGTTRIHEWFGRSSALPTAWVSVLVILGAASWIGQFLRPIEASDAIEVIAFFGALISITAAVIVVLAGLATANIEEAIRLSRPRNAPISWTHR